LKKSVLLRFLNAVLFSAFLASALSMIFYRWGPRSTRGMEWVYNIHEIAGIVFFILALGHIVMNWGWIRASFFKSKAKR